MFSCTIIEQSGRSIPCQSLCELNEELTIVIFTRQRESTRKTDSTTKQLEIQLKAQAAGILAEGVVLSSFRHKGLSGIEREGPIRRFLETHLPPRFRVGQGAIASSAEILNHQHDIIIADQDLSFTLLSTVNAQLFPIESVQMIVEVRSRDNELDSLGRAFRSVRNLRANPGLRQLGSLGTDIGTTPPPVQTLILFKGPKRANTLIKRLKTINSYAKGKDGRMLIDFVLVLATDAMNDPSSGYMIGYSRTDTESGHVFRHHLYPQINEEGLDGPKLLVEGDLSFARWYAAIIQHLSGVTVYPPSFSSYLGDKLTFAPWKKKPY